MRRLKVVVTTTSVVLSMLFSTHGNLAAGPIDGSRANDLCFDFKVPIPLLPIDYDTDDPGWVWVDARDKYRSVSGLVTASHVAHTDFPFTHDSHDQDTIIRVDPGQED